MSLEYDGSGSEWYDGKYSAKAYARVVEERYKGLRLSRVVTGGNLCPSVANISGGRIPMINNQTGQHLPLVNPRPPQLMAGVEADWAKTVVDARIDAVGDVVAMQRLNKYKIIPGVMPQSNTEYLIWRDMENGQIGITEIPHMVSNHAFSASVLTPTKSYQNVSYGDMLRKDEVLAYGSSRTESGNYAYGIDVNWCWLGRYSTNEDAIEVSRSFCDKMRSVKTDKMSFWVYGDDILLNIHGSINDVRPLPTVGDVIGDKGIVAALRKNIRAFSLIGQRKDCLTVANRPFDKPYTTIAGSRVIEVQVKRHGRGDFKYLSSPTARYMDTLAESSLAMHRTILEIDAAERRTAGANYPRHLSWHCAVVQAEKELMAAGHKTVTVNRKVVSGLRSGENIPTSKPTIGDKPYSYYVTITLTKVHQPELGDKFTNRHGAKSVIGKITDDEDMPLDLWGRRADVITNPVGVSNRNIPVQLNEAYFNDTCYHAFNHLKTLDSVEQQVAYLLDLYSVMSIETAHTIATLCDTPEMLRAHVKSVLDDGRIDIINENGDPTLSVHGVNLIHNSKYRPPYDRVTVTSEITGKRNLTPNKVRIAPVYTFALDKIGKYANATNISPRQSLGFVAKATSRDKDLSHISQTSNRHSGYTEVRSTAANSNPADAAYTISSNNSQAAMEVRVEGMLSGTLLAEAIDINTINLGRGLELFNHELGCFGHELTRGDNEDA